MGKKIIRLTEFELKKLIAESINELLKESSIIMPAIADTVISQTDNSIIKGEYHTNINNKKVEPVNHNNNARILRNKLLTHYILQEIGNIHFTFLKYDRGVDKLVAVTFDMVQVKECTKDGFALRGVMKMPTNNQVVDKNADVFYDNNSKQFTSYTYENGNRKRDLLTLPTNGSLNLSNDATYKRLIYLVEDFINVCDICIEESNGNLSIQEFYKAVSSKMNEKYK